MLVARRPRIGTEKYAKLFSLLDSPAPPLYYVNDEC
jgi:hypothetical protein